jgi:hypothetical protein
VGRVTRTGAAGAGGVCTAWAGGVGTGGVGGRTSLNEGPGAQEGPEDVDSGGRDFSGATLRAANDRIPAAPAATIEPRKMSLVAPVETW